MTLRAAACTLIVIIALPAHAAVNPSSLFTNDRTKGHTDGHGEKVAPDLLIGHIAAAGAELSAKPPTRAATTATPAEMARGKELFMGTAGAPSSAASCASCHIARGFVAARRATFGGDLTHIYSRLEDGNLTAFLKHPCFPRVLGQAGGSRLSEDEAFSIKAFLRQVDREAPK